MVHPQYPKYITAVFKTAFSVNDKPQTQGRKIIDATFLPSKSKLAIALSDGTLKIYDIVPEIGKYSLIFGQRSFFNNEFLNSKGKFTFSDNAIAFNPINSSLFYFKTPNSLVVTNLENKEVHTIYDNILAYKLNYYHPKADDTILVLTTRGKPHPGHNFIGTISQYSANLTQLQSENDCDFYLHMMPVCKNFEGIFMLNSYKTETSEILALELLGPHEYQNPKLVPKNTQKEGLSYLDTTCTKFGVWIAAVVDPQYPRDKYLVVWKNREVHMQVETPLAAITFSPDKKYLFGIGEDSLLHTWNMETREHQEIPWPQRVSPIPSIPIDTYRTGPHNPPTFAALYFTADGEHLIEVLDQYIFIWSLRSDFMGSIRGYIQTKPQDFISDDIPEQQPVIPEHTSKPLPLSQEEHDFIKNIKLPTSEDEE